MKSMKCKKINGDRFEVYINGSSPIVVNTEDFYARLRNILDRGNVSSVEFEDKSLRITRLSFNGEFLIKNSVEYEFYEFDENVQKLVDDYSSRNSSSKDYASDLEKNMMPRMVQVVRDLIVPRETKSLLTKEEIEFTLGVLKRERFNFLLEHGIFSYASYQNKKLFIILGVILGIIGLSATIIGFVGGILSGLSGLTATAVAGFGLRKTFAKMESRVEDLELDLIMERLESLSFALPNGEELVSEEEDILRNDNFIERLKKDISVIENCREWNASALSTRFLVLLDNYKKARIEEHSVGKKLNYSQFLKSLCNLEIELFSLNDAKGSIREPVLDYSTYVLAIETILFSIDDNEEVLSTIRAAKDLVDRIYKSPYEGCEVHLLRTFLAVQELVDCVKFAGEISSEIRRHFLYQMRNISSSSEKAQLEAEFMDSILEPAEDPKISTERKKVF